MSPGPRRDTPAARRVLTLLVLLAALAGAFVQGAGTAQAAGYRYWSFWQLGQKGWAYAAQGPSVAKPDDGAVDGFRFSVSEDSQDASKPRGAHDFAAICHGTTAVAGHKRIALVLDFGTAADAPPGESPPKPRTACARVAGDASSAEALAAVAGQLRYDSNALLCAVAGYPHTGCGEQVPGRQHTGSADGDGATDRATSPAPHAPAHHTPSVGLIAGIAAVALLGIAAVWQARRRRG